MKRSIIKSLKELEDFSEKFLKNLKWDLAKPNSATLIQLSGDLGSGKTTFVQNIGKILGIKEKILSPTFTISKIYKIPKNKFTNKKNLIHIDAYRLGEKNSIQNIGLNEQLKNHQNLIFIEWPEIIKKELINKTEKKIQLNFKYISENKREINQ